MPDLSTLCNYYEYRLKYSEQFLVLGFVTAHNEVAAK